MMYLKKKSSLQLRVEKVPPEEENSRLDRFLRRLVKGLTQSLIERMLRNGLIKVDGYRVKANHRLFVGQNVSFPSNLKPLLGENTITSPPILTNPSLQKRFDEMVLDEGRGWIALNKPSGLAVQGGSSVGMHLDGILQALSSKTNGRLRLVHRLDKDTSGVLLLAKTLPSARKLTAEFQSQSFEKTYLAIVEGVPSEKGRISLPLKKLKGRADEKVIVSKDGQNAITLFHRLDHNGSKLSFIALRPLTGRTHQLRVHMQHLKTPIFGDNKYGKKRMDSDGALRRRLHLHAWRLKLTDGKIITAPLSSHFDASVKKLGFALPAPSWCFED